MSNSTTSTTTTQTTPNITARSVVGFLVFCEIASGFVQGYYPALLADIAANLQVSDADITWFLTVQTLSAAVSVPLLSKLGDIYGHRRILRIATLCVLIGVFITALLPSYPVVLAARILVGPLAVWLPLEIALVHNRISGHTARASIGILAASLTGGAIFGTISSGLISAFSPSLTLTLMVPVVLVVGSVFAVFFKVPESTHLTKSTIDIPGFIGLSIAMVALLFGLRLASSSGFSSGSTLGTLAVALLVFTLWVKWELKTESPAVDIRMIVSGRLGPIYLTAFLFGMVLFGTQSPITTFLSADPDQVGYGFAGSASTASAVIAVITIMATIGASLFAPISRKIGIRAVLITGAVLPAGAWIFQIIWHTELWHIVSANAVGGIGMGLLMGALPALLAELAPTGSTGIAAGIYNSLRTLGGAAAGAIFALVLASFTAEGELVSDLGGYLTIWAISAAAFIIAIIALSRMQLPDTSLQSTNH
ncbi:MFS transporter [Corynebacterium alimapuense]|uniref:MFS transporter n=1 Tax=Corynebacterium alimapuense TaxID=1576874 RepID=A0A3M8KAV6_9CORY|nr:MFS transporter [Corynebacterium alimapuense]RNE49999.1 MFS transporter [Corynebacterium alimapuense]